MVYLPISHTAFGLLEVRYIVGGGCTNLGRLDFPPSASRNRVMRNDEDAAVFVFPPGSRRRCRRDICYLCRKITRISRVLQVTVTSNQRGALFHAPVMFSPGVERDLTNLYD